MAFNKEQSELAPLSSHAFGSIAEPITPSMKKHFEKIGKIVFKHRNINEIELDNNMLIPCESSRELEHAKTLFDISDSMFQIIRVSHFTGKYYLILTRYKGKYYKVMYSLKDDTNIIYSFRDI